MQALRESGELELGVLVAGVLHRAFTLRPATLADTYQAAAAVPVPANLADDQSAKVAYQMAVDDAQVLCQIVTLGTLPTVPTPQAMAAELDPDDMALLRQAAAEVKKKRLQSRPGWVSTDAPSTSSFAQDLASPTSEALLTPK